MPTTLVRFAPLGVAALLLLTGCKPKAGGVPNAETPAPAVVDGQPATADDCKEFGQRVERAVAARDRPELERLLSVEDLALRCISDLNLPADQQRSLTTGVQRGARKGVLVDQILGEVEKGATYKLLRVHDVDGRPRALFRMASADTGVNYHDCILAGYPDGRVGLEDVFIFLSGEMMTQSMRRIMLPAAAELNRGLAARLGGTDKTFLDNMPRIQALTQAVNTGNNEEAVRQYNGLPAGLRNNKTLMIAYVRAAAGVDDATYTAALEAFRQAFPNDPAIEFISVDYFILKKQYDEALRCVGAVEKAVGGDPFLRVIRTNVLIEANRFEPARAEAEKAVAEEPDLVDAYWSRITVALKEKNHKDTLAWLQKVVEKTGTEVEDLETLDEYKEFVKSPEHAAWKKWYAGRKKG